jgi:hypothetical protein
MPSAGSHPASLSLCAGWTHPGGVCPTFYNGVFDWAVRRLRPPHEPSPRAATSKPPAQAAGWTPTLGRTSGCCLAERGARLSILALT